MEQGARLGLAYLDVLVEVVLQVTEILIMIVVGASWWY